jgi:hypothetical protein
MQGQNKRNWWLLKKRLLRVGREAPRVFFFHQGTRWFNEAKCCKRSNAGFWL